MTRALTGVSLVFIAHRIDVYLRFGHPEQQQRINGRCRSVFFAPGQTFCRIWREPNAYGTTRWQLTILHTKPPGRFVQRIAGVAPGAGLLLHVEGEHSVQLVLRLISTIEAQRVDTTHVAPTFWRTVHHRLVVRTEVPAYTPLRHAVYLCREAMS